MLWMLKSFSPACRGKVSVTKQCLSAAAQQELPPWLSGDDDVVAVKKRSSLSPPLLPTPINLHASLCFGHSLRLLHFAASSALCFVLRQTCSGAGNQSLPRGVAPRKGRALADAARRRPQTQSLLFAAFPPPRKVNRRGSSGGPASWALNSHFSSLFPSLRSARLSLDGGWGEGGGRLRACHPTARRRPRRVPGEGLSTGSSGEERGSRGLDSAPVPWPFAGIVIRDEDLLLKTLPAVQCRATDSEPRATARGLRKA
ncbi:hypothetical protein SKAU_G00104740 [Synaphobranchus kaupii]|uniref:Uncharacterized protein n=1 Tax=Synaphobranchus kaupii TaxID=118154 RepID=A0A9Q1G091_SYNKA|nr:hypothetical protein SKAU_G00104740 [Synaphobranchus kaupii]